MHQRHASKTSHLERVNNPVVLFCEVSVPNYFFKSPKGLRCKSCSTYNIRGIGDYTPEINKGVHTFDILVAYRYFTLNS